MFIEIAVGSHQILHGFDEENKEVIEDVKVSSFSTKLIEVGRIKSISEKYILTDYGYGRWIYWEYEGSMAELKARLQMNNLVL
ncbi:hypothetical protein [Jiulongibacter sediminis]|uniref:Uncharacterized protein n=1 Tax=Jiulongibacter sediminis TaxID=1605367 RepID=A0A0P7C4T5_9BACT|nr:hypothetical protein [Jiulongibacter sediminis]KPM49704.1 hypothetical protein AFM12_03720 [Jiulongibacter sediminis]TBX26744.1 hypothetical protein TK44_03725 [Jiulongibacter sediminis]